VLLALVLGGDYGGGAGGVLILICAASLLGGAIASPVSAVALLARTRETVGLPAARLVVCAGFATRAIGTCQRSP
jgi:hypothetical protein